MNITLVGMPGCGKSTIGVLAAKAMMMDFVDTDLILQKQSGKPLQQMVDELGTDGFSLVEEETIMGLDLDNAVIATGGSVALEPRAMEHLKKISLVVFIRLPYKTISKRLKNLKTRGVTIEKGQTLHDLYEYRQPYYEACADIVLDSQGLTAEETVDQLVELVKEAGSKAK